MVHPSTGFTPDTVIESSETRNLSAFVVSLLADTTYELRVQAIGHSGHRTDFLALGSTSTLSDPPTGISIDEVFETSMTVSWNTVTSQGYVLELSSTDFDGSGTVYSSATTNGSLGSLIVEGLERNTTYYARVASLNWNSMRSWADDGSRPTLTQLLTGAQVFEAFTTSVTVNWHDLPASPQSASAEGYLVENPIGRYALGDQDDLHYNSDGSLDLYVQHEIPDGKESNWLPAPEGSFGLALRLYWPREEILTRKWKAPPVQRVE